jgi:hypothetical protein
MPTDDSARDAMPDSSAPDARELLVACLCAQWCRTCDEYLGTFEQVRDEIAAAHPALSARFVWIDIEDEAELIGDLDIENFPTVVIALGAEVVFAGTLLPHAQTLERVARGALEGNLPRPAAPWPADLLALPRRVAGRPGI